MGIFPRVTRRNRPYVVGGGAAVLCLLLIYSRKNQTREPSHELSAAEQKGTLQYRSNPEAELKANKKRIEVDAVNAIVYPDHESKAAVAQPPPPPPPSPPLLPLAGEEAAMAIPDGAPRGPRAAASENAPHDAVDEWTDAGCHPQRGVHKSEQHTYLKKAFGHNPSMRCKSEYAEAWCKLEKDTLMPHLTSVGKQCVEPTGYHSKADHPKHGVPARIAFVINAYQAGMYEQIVRLFHTLYSPGDWFLFHIDGRSKLLRALMIEFVKDYDNAFVAPFAYETIWGSTYLYKTYLHTIKHLLGVGDWDFFINLSEADFPVLPLADLRSYLGHRRGKSFLAGSTNARKEKSFCDKQGINHTFYQCEGFMYTVGKRQMPEYRDVSDGSPGFHFIGGSDWYVIDRQYGEYLTHDTSDYLKRIKNWYNMSLLSGESFFHTVAYNGPFCHAVMWYNLRNENWQGKAGCYCRKDVVDWCGCSPMVFREKMMHRLLNVPEKFFARKFDPRIDIYPINAMEAVVNGHDDMVYPQMTYLETLHAPRIWNGDNFIKAHFNGMSAVIEPAVSTKLRVCAGDGADPVFADLTMGHALHEQNPRGDQQMWFSSFTLQLEYVRPDGGGSYSVEVLVDNPFSLQSSSTGKPLLTELIVATSWDKKEHLFKSFIFNDNSDIKASLIGPQGGEDPCAKYGGIIHRDGKVCCDQKCGNFCGTYDCDKGPGGGSKCCAGTITKRKNKCIIPDMKSSPCMLDEDTQVGQSVQYEWLTPDGRTAHKGTSPSVGSRPIELEMESDFEKPHMAGIWTIRATFMEDGKSLGIYEKKFAVVSNTVLPHELLGMSEVYKVKGICSTDAGAGADRGGGAAGGDACKEIDQCDTQSWSTFFKRSELVGDQVHSRQGDQERQRRGKEKRRV